MTQNTKIEWADHTFNPWRGCTKVGPGCDNCYAEAMDKRFGGNSWGPGKPRIRHKNWTEPVKWNKQADTFFAEHGRRQRVFCASIGDIFDNEVDLQWRADLFYLIQSTPRLDWLLLTKRIGNAEKMMQVAHEDWRTFEPKLPYPNVWLGATICNQEEADRDIPKLLAVPAAKRFLSIEPMLGAIDLQKACTRHCPNRSCFTHSSGHRVVVDSTEGGMLFECICSRLNGLHWVICGGESGPGARPLHPDWARSLRDQCATAGVPFLFKQWGEWVQAPFDHGRGWSPSDPKQMMLQDGQEDGHTLMIKVGKKAAGRLLDGVEHNGTPI